MLRRSGTHVLSMVQVRTKCSRTVTCPEHQGQAMLRTGSSQLTSTSYPLPHHRFTRTHMQTHDRHTCTHKNKPQVHKHTHANSQVHLHTCKHTVGSYAHTNIQHRFTCIHIQTHSRSPYTDTLRFVESHIGRPLQTPTISTLFSISSWPSPLAGTPFLSQLPFSSPPGKEQTYSLQQQRK